MIAFLIGLAVLAVMLFVVAYCGWRDERKRRNREFECAADRAIERNGKALTELGKH